MTGIGGSGLDKASITNGSDSEIAKIIYTTFCFMALYLVFILSVTDFSSVIINLQICNLFL